MCCHIKNTFEREYIVMKTNQVPPPAYRVFISSTYVDMIPYRDASQTAITNCDAVAYGMERFVPAPIRPHLINA